MRLQKLPAFTDAALRALADITGEDTQSMIDDVRRGSSELWCVDGHSYMVTCVDNASRELIVCCYAGRDIIAIANVLYRIARNQNLQAVRFFTKRPALARKLQRGFPLLKEYGRVYRCEVPPNVAQ